MEEFFDIEALMERRQTSTTPMGSSWALIRPSSIPVVCRLRAPRRRRSAASRRPRRSAPARVRTAPLGAVRTAELPRAVRMRAARACSGMALGQRLPPPLRARTRRRRVQPVPNALVERAFARTMRIPNGESTMRSSSTTSRAAPGRIVRAGALAPTAERRRCWRGGDQEGARRQGPRRAARRLVARCALP